jgi:hypothetical protein
MSEEHGRIELVRNRGARGRGSFDFASFSDHFVPWLEQQEHPPLAWTVVPLDQALPGRAVRRAPINGSRRGNDACLTDPTRWNASVPKRRPRSTALEFRNGAAR